MTRKDLIKLKKYFKEIYPNVWEHYKFLYERRIVDTHARFDFLLLMNTFLFIVFTQFFYKLINISQLFYITTIFLILPTPFYFIYLFPPKLSVPWFETQNIKDVFESRRKNDFYEVGLRSIYGVAPSLWIYIVKRSKSYKVCVNLLMLSIFSIPIILTSLYFSQFSIAFSLIASFDVSVIASFFIYLINIYLTRPIENPTLDIENFFNEWKKNTENQK